MKFSDKKIFLILILLLILLGIVSALENSRSAGASLKSSNRNSPSPQLYTYATTTITFPNGVIIAQIADTIDKETQGLSNRSNLPQGQGMLFVFNTPAIQYMWMKDMNFSLDMVWLDQNKNVTYIAADVTPQSYEKNPPEVFSSPTPASYVIELPASDATRLGIKLGMKINFAI